MAEDTSDCILVSHLEWGPPVLRDFVNANKLEIRNKFENPSCPIFHHGKSDHPIQS